MTQTSTPINRVIESDLHAHIEDEFLYAARSSPVPQTYNLGQYTLETSIQGIELSNHAVALQLDLDEAYKLLLALQSLFCAV
jgi:hypothetical protein